VDMYSSEDLAKQGGQPSFLLMSWGVRNEVHGIQRPHPALNYDM
jgi:hypothetical protein